MKRIFQLGGCLILTALFTLWLVWGQEASRNSEPCTKAAQSDKRCNMASAVEATSTWPAPQTNRRDLSARNPVLADILSRSAEFATRIETSATGGREETRLYRTPEKYPHWRVKTIWDEHSEFLRDEVAVADHLIVQADPASIDDTMAALVDAGLSVRRQLWAPGLLLISGPEPSLDALEQLGLSIQQIQAEGIEQTSLDVIVFATATPDDPLFSNQWCHNSTHAKDPDMDSTEAWDMLNHADDVVVAVIDSGIDHLHEDLAANMWTNTGEIEGNGIDDDENGLIDDYHGYDFANDDGDPMDDNQHGTHCAGIIAAVGNNGVGVSGVAWRTKLMGLKFLSASGSGSLSDALNSIYYAAFMGADITSNSWGALGSVHPLISEYIAMTDTPFIASAGNDGLDTDINSHIPTSSEEPNIIAVGAHTASDNLAYYSNYGLETVDLSAPGSSILSTLPSNRYGYLSGTSMAAPQVAGCVALMMQLRPELTTAEIKAMLLATVTPVTYLEGKAVSGGRVNLNDFLFDGLLPPVITSMASAQGFLGAAFDFDVTAANYPTAFTATVLPGSLSLDAATGEITGQPDATGEYTVTLTASNLAGSDEQTWTLTVGNELEHWIFENLGLGQSVETLAEQDTNSDGISDIVNYGTGGSYNDPEEARTKLPKVEEDNDRLLFTFRRLEGSGTGSTVDGYTVGGVTYKVYCSDDLADWQTGASALEQIGSPVSNGDGTESVTVGGLGEGDFCFYRLEILPAN
ncbi:S8 family serine peptidase [Cerasicoccus fimbriatus]|uniref:S8 family serine peptidase n=1 Tax=Cerasicoccus fimbriatus TaxID=3014554 RepID=UPI0022B5B515|nr:S8 family serine peptidase [Cerasicoccus sp. TK19100]